MVVTFDQALDTDETDKGSSVHKTQRGDKFEELMSHYFRNNSIYKDVKLWYDWFHEQGAVIYLVEDKDCKCWNDDSSIDLENITPLRKMDRLIIVFTGANVSKHTERRCYITTRQIALGVDHSNNVEWTYHGPRTYKASDMGNTRIWCARNKPTKVGTVHHRGTR